MDPTSTTQSASGQRILQKPSQRSQKRLARVPLSSDLLRHIHDLMVKSRVLEERMIKIYRVGEAYFWIGGPGEEAFGVPLGLLARKGRGVDCDWFHLHYRCTPTLVALGMNMVDPIRLLMNKVTDTSSGGRNFSGHYCYPEWNVSPVSSPIGVQYSMAIGTAWVQKCRRSKGISIVTGGDAGSAEGDFASCLIWSSRKGQELPLLITVQNNSWGISTAYEGQHGEEHISDRGKPFRMRTAVINGNDPIESYIRLGEEIDYIRRTGKPVVLEARVSRLYGHSSASGANFVKEEEDGLKEFEKKLLKQGVLTEASIQALWLQYEEEARRTQERVREEGDPQARSIWDHYFTDGENGNWRHF